MESKGLSKVKWRNSMYISNTGSSIWRSHNCRINSQPTTGRKVTTFHHVTCHTLIYAPPYSHRRKAFDSMDGHAYTGCMGKRKSRRKIMYSSHHSGQFECYNLVLYEPVTQVENFQYRTLVLIGKCLMMSW